MRAGYLDRGLWKARGYPDYNPTIPDPPVSGFVHPGVMYTRAQLDFVKAKLAANQAPWTTAYSRMLSSSGGNGANTGVAYGSASYTPTPRAWIGRGAYNGDGSTYDSDCMNDLRAALCHALIWYYKGTRASAQKSIEIMNGWATTLTEIKFDATNWADGKLLAGWTGTMFARAAELIKHTFTPTGGETALNVTAVQNVLINEWWPLIGFGHSGAGANTLTTMADAMIQIAVFLDDQAKFDSAVQFMRDQILGVIWMVGDDNPYAWADPRTFTYTSTSVTLTAPNGLPYAPKNSQYDKEGLNYNNFMKNYWYQPTTLPSGLETETGRDFHHMAMGHAGIGNVCETAWHQGTDLYEEFRARLTASMELNTKFIYDTFVGKQNPPPGWPFATNATGSSGATQRETYRIPWNHYVNRRGLNLPNTTTYLNNYGLAATSTVDVAGICWETLTSYGTP